jgi:hypothetical protein
MTLTEAIGLLMRGTIYEKQNESTNKSNYTEYASNIQCCTVVLKFMC